MHFTTTTYAQTARRPTRRAPFTEIFSGERPFPKGPTGSAVPTSDITYFITISNKYEA